MGSRGRLSYERRVHLNLWIFAADTLVAVALLLAYAHASVFVWLVVMIPLSLATWFAVTAIVERLVRPLQTIANVLVALRVGDYSLRVRGGRRGDSLGDLAIEVNALANDLQGERMFSLESSALLQRVLAAIDAPVLAFDPDARLAMLNQAAERLLPGRPKGQLAAALGLDEALRVPEGSVLSLGSGIAAQWLVHRSRVRLHGRPHTLLLLADVSRALREEERLAWQRLIRVLGHEINNSLAPIKSLAGSLRTMVVRGDFETEDFARSLAVIEERADSLNRFLSAYRHIAQLPLPKKAAVDVPRLLERLALLETRVAVRVVECAVRNVHADGDQLEQALINLLRNAAEATLQSGSTDAVEVACFAGESVVTIQVTDCGLGVSNPSNLFVPFYTTKEHGSGLGLMLVKQIAEAHGGSVLLVQRADGRSGAIAEMRLPVV